MPATSIRFLLLLFALSLQGLPVHGAEPDDADIRLFRAQLTVAEKGNARAQYYLGEMHEHGLGTRQDINEALKWYTKAADQGDPLARRKLAHIQETISESKKEQAAEKPEPPKPVAKPANPAPITRSRPAPAAVAPIDQTKQKDEQELEQERIKQERIKAAERDKKRAMVREMILERMRNPVGEAFE